MPPVTSSLSGLISLSIHSLNSLCSCNNILFKDHQAGPIPLFACASLSKYFFNVWWRETMKNSYTIESFLKNILGSVKFFGNGGGISAVKTIFYHNILRNKTIVFNTINR